jgi:hypothetical protein
MPNIFIYGIQPEYRRGSQRSNLALATARFAVSSPAGMAVSGRSHALGLEQERDSQSG